MAYIIKMEQSASAKLLPIKHQEVRSREGVLLNVKILVALVIVDLETENIEL